MFGNESKIPGGEAFGVGQEDPMVAIGPTGEFGIWQHVRQRVAEGRRDMIASPGHDQRRHGHGGKPGSRIEPQCVGHRPSYKTSLWSEHVTDRRLFIESARLRARLLRSVAEHHHVQQFARISLADDGGPRSTQRQPRASNLEPQGFEPAPVIEEGKAVEHA